MPTAPIGPGPASASAVRDINSTIHQVKHCPPTLGTGKAQADDGPAFPPRRRRAATGEGHRPQRRFWPLAGTATDPARARHLIRAVLTRWDLEPLVDTAELLVNELVTNVLDHANGPMWLHVLREDQEIFFAVWDGDPHLPALQPSDHLAESGRGLWLVEVLAHRWGAHAVSGLGKVVWYSLYQDTHITAQHGQDA
jgi:hypothetical protein